MALKNQIYKIRCELKMTQTEFAELFSVSRQTVQKWESGESFPELAKLIDISKRFDISLDTLILDRDLRTLEELKNKKLSSPDYSYMHDWEFYPSAILDEYHQCIDEGLDIELYKDLFINISKLPKGDIKKKFGDVIFDIVCNSKQKSGYKYNEPSDLEGIKSLRNPFNLDKTLDKTKLEEKLHGAWLGRICGCMLGKSVETVRTSDLISFLKSTGNYPMHRYILRSDVDSVDISGYKYNFAHRSYVDLIDGMPSDDDTNYTVLSELIVSEFGRDFTSSDVSYAWLKYQPKDAYCTAERVAFCNFIKGYMPPFSATYQNPYREWIGAQIRTDYYGYINPGNPELAAEMAHRDASISHVKNGIYGAMFVSAMLAAAAVTDDFEEIVLAGIAEIPSTSRLYESIMSVINGYKAGISKEKCFKNIHETWDENTGYGWCHTISNAMIVTAALLYGNGNYGKSICMAVENAFDTDCNGATVGSVVGMAKGIGCINKYWSDPINDTLYTNISGLHSVKISDMVKKTIKHII